MRELNSLAKDEASRGAGTQAGFAKTQPLTVQMFSEKLLFVFAYKITTTTTSVFRWCLQTLWEQQFQKQAWERTSQALGTCFPSLPQLMERFLKAVTESWATQCWGAGHTLHLNDLQMTFTALHFNFPRHRFRGELFVILCQDNGMSLHSQILISFPRYQSLHTYPLPEKKKKKSKQNTNKNNY